MRCERCDGVGRLGGGNQPLLICDQCDGTGDGVHVKLVQLARRIESLRHTVMALIEVLGGHPDFNGPLGDALLRRGVDLKADERQPPPGEVRGER